MIIKTPFTPRISIIFFLSFLIAQYLHNFIFIYKSFLFFSYFLRLDNLPLPLNPQTLLSINYKKIFLKPKNLLKKLTWKTRKLLFGSPHFNFYEKKSELHNNYYELHGSSSTETSWMLKPFQAFKWNQLFFITFYSSSLKTFKYFYNNYFYIKSKIFFHHNFPPYTSITAHFQTVNEIFNPDTFSLNFLNLPEKKSINFLAISWQLDFLEWIKAYNESTQIIKKPMSSKKTFNLYLTNQSTSYFSYFNNERILQKQTLPNVEKKKWIFYNKFFLISKDLTSCKIQHFYNIIIDEKYIFNSKTYFVFWQKFFSFKVKPFLFFKSFFQKNFTIHFSKTLPKTNRSIFLNIQNENYENYENLFFETNLRYYSVSSSPFLAAIPGFFFINSSKKFNDVSMNLLSSLKSKIYSFFEKFDLHKLIVKNVTKISFVNTFSPFFYSAPTLNSPQLTSTLFKYNLISWNILSDFSTNSIYDDFYLNKKLPWLLHFYNNLTVEYAGKLNLKIQRIKFKPGYMIYWRNARKELKNVLNLKFRYQFNLSRYLSRYNKHNQYLAFLTSEMFLNTVLLNSKILPYRHVISDFIKNHFIYINGWCITQENFQLYKNDFLQISIHVKYYMYYKYLMNLLIQDKLYVKKVVFYKNQHVLTQKQKPSSYPNKLKKKFYIENDVPKYLEVDFFSLSIYVLYDPFLAQDFSLEQRVLNRFSILKLYNWKYIT